MTGLGHIDIIAGSPVSNLTRMEQRASDVEAKVKRMLAMGAEIRAHMREPVSSDLRDLYDDEGMPL